MVEHDMVIKL